MSESSHILHIDRSKSNAFKPNKFLGPVSKGGGWVIDEQDERALSITKLDLTKVLFETTLRGTKVEVTGEEQLTLLKEIGHIRLDAKVFQLLYENQELIPEGWKERMDGETRYILFHGTVLRFLHNNDREVMCLHWYFRGKWSYGFSCLKYRNDIYHPSAVILSHQT